MSSIRRPWMSARSVVSPFKSRDKHSVAAESALLQPQHPGPHQRLPRHRRRDLRAPLSASSEPAAPSGGNDEFIEIYNSSDSPIDISGWKIKGSNSAGSTSVRLTVAASTTLPAHAHFLATNAAAAGYSGTVAGDQTYTVGITDDGGIALTLPNDTIVDQVGMSAGSLYKEGTTLTPLTATGTNQGYERKPGGASGSTQDTNNNATDFMVTAPSDPQDLASKPTPGSVAPQITNGPPPSPVIVGTPYSFSFTATGNPPPTFSFTGILPPGLGLSAAGLLSGTATSGGTGTFPGITVTASNGTAPDATQSFALTTETRATNYLAGFGLPGANAVYTFDYDGDGIANLLEFGLGLDPTIAGLNGLPVVTLKDYSGIEYLSMTFNRSSLATDLTYIVQGSSDLTNWTDLGTSNGGMATSGAGFIMETGSAPTFTVEVRDIVPYDPSAMGKRFIRLKITSP